MKTGSGRSFGGLGWPELEQPAPWSTTERLVRLGYRGLNPGLSLMILLDLFPAGVLQLSDVIAHGYWHARRLTYTMSGTFHLLEWIRVAGDVVFLVLGALPITVAAALSYLRRDVGPGRARA